jgi:hypothetical protein
MCWTVTLANEGRTFRELLGRARRAAASSSLMVEFTRNLRIIISVGIGSLFSREDRPQTS